MAGVSRMLPAACCVVIFAFALVQVHAQESETQLYPTAQLAALESETQLIPTTSRPTGPRCHPVHIPDVMGISKCLNGTLNLCGLNKQTRRSASRALGKCLVTSLATKNFLTIILGMLRAGLRFVLRIAFPGSTSVVYPFWQRVKNLFRRRRQPEPSKILFTSRPCNDTIPVYFPDFLRIADCVRPEHFMCSKTGSLDIGSSVVTSVLSMVVCILKKLPFFNVLRLVKDVACNFLTLMIKLFEKTRALKFMVPVTELVQIILSCRVSSPLPVTAERMLINDNIL
uniref:Uncharacterized protein n=1 Tax=Amblyomma maculatum TaxID=34609 RepID=G3MS73_AMBMU